MTEPTSLLLPTVIYAVPGVRSRIVFDNLVIDARGLRFQCDCLLGSSDGRHWTLIPQEAEVGDFPLVLTVDDEQRGTRTQVEGIVKVVPGNAGSGATLKLMMVGDSHLHASVYPAEVLRLLSRVGNPTTVMLGTHHPSTAPPGVVHEGYGGWTWERFVSYYDPEDPDPPHRATSPFVFPGSGVAPVSVGAPVLDVARYFEEFCEGETPDLVTFQLGANDCIRADPNDPAGMDRLFDHISEQANILLAQFQRAAPHADLGLLLPPPPNARDAAFVANYGETITRENWLRVRHRLTRRMMEHFGDRQNERIFLIPTQASLDPLADLPEDNALHPNDGGYRQIGADIYTWIKWRLAHRFS